MGVQSIGLLVNLTRFVYDGFNFATSWTIFLILIIALVQAVLTIKDRFSEVLILWVIIFTLKILFKVFGCNEEECGEFGWVGNGARMLYDSFMWSLEMSLFIVIMLAVYNLALLVYSNLKHALTMWLVLFVGYVLLKSMYGHTMYHYEDWN